MKFLSGVWSAMRRELRIMVQRPVYLMASVGVMTFCMVFFGTFFREGVPQDLPIGVVDLDNTSLSRNMVRQIDATQLGKTIGFGSYTEAREAMQTGSICAFFLIPDGMYADVLSGRQPEFTFYVNSLYMVGGALAYKDLLMMSNMISGGIQREVLRSMGLSDEAAMARIQPVAVDAHQIGNAATSYNVYLTNMLVPGILEMTVILMTVYALCSELKYGTSRHLLEKSGGSMTAAMTGKLAVYTVLFTAMGIVCDIFLYHWAGFPLKGSIWNMFLATFLMILASEAVGFFIAGTLPVLRIALSIAALFSTLALSLTGFTFPVEALPPAVRGLSVLFPLRHYYLIYVQETIFGSGFTGWYFQAICLLLFLLLPLPVYARLRAAYVKQNFPRN